ncbi:MAG: phosphate/phosphite/phosphonate ABC transporter substrate-binding protein [Aquificae bacterium]|nr:phosphate/phosphite/phosphonate ABC transporter substrate-binding protein [Aquificota bacterium]
MVERSSILFLILFYKLSYAFTLAILSAGNPVQEYKRFKNLSEYLAKRINEPVELKIIAKVDQLLYLYEKEQIDMSITCPIVYFELKDRGFDINAVAVIKINGQILESGVIVVRKDSDIKTVKDLKDKRVTLGSSICASNCVMPLYVLSKEGITYEDIPDLWSSGSDKAAILAVIAGLADAAGVKEESALKFLDKGIKILAKSPYVPRYVVNLSTNLPKRKFRKIVKSLYHLNDEKTLKRLGIDAFVPPPAGLFDILKDYKSILNQYPMLK